VEPSGSAERHGSGEAARLGPRTLTHVALLCASLLVAVAFLLSACAGSSPTPPGSSGVKGTAMIEGGPAGWSPRPEPGVHVIAHKGGRNGRVAASVRVGSNGEFKMDLPPGTYTLLEVPNSLGPRKVTVEPGRYVTVTLMVEAF